MKCSVCYHENPTWQKICTFCGQPAVSLQLCASGHLLEPNQTECEVCPSLWPDPGPHQGPPILRGILYLDHGLLKSEEGGSHLPFLELRDREESYSLLVEGSGVAQLVSGDEAKVDVKVSVRPENIRYCASSAYRSESPGNEADGIVYNNLSGQERFRVGPVTFRVLFFSVPDWVAREPEKNPSL